MSLSGQPIVGKKREDNSFRFAEQHICTFLTPSPTHPHPFFLPPHLPFFLPTHPLPFFFPTSAQVSGIQVVYNMEAPPGSRVCSIKTCENGTWTDLDDERSYPMVVGNYIANGGDGYTSLSDNKWGFIYSIHVTQSLPGRAMFLERWTVRSSKATLRLTVRFTQGLRGESRLAPPAKIQWKVRAAILQVL